MRTPIAFALVLVTGITHASVDSGRTKKRAAVTRLECGAAVKSLVSNTSLHLEFANHTSGTIAIYWLDFSGARVLYSTLAPGEAYTQQTYVTHPWVIVDADGRCLEQLVPNAAGTFAVPIR